MIYTNYKRLVNNDISKASLFLGKKILLPLIDHDKQPSIDSYVVDSIADHRRGPRRPSIYKYGGEGMITMMVMMYNWIWENEYTPKRWREGVVVNLFKKG